MPPIAESQSGLYGWQSERAILLAQRDALVAALARAEKALMKALAGLDLEVLGGES